MGGFVASPSPSPKALTDVNSDDGAKDDDDDVDEDASSFGNDVMTTTQR